MVIDEELSQQDSESGIKKAIKKVRMPSQGSKERPQGNKTEVLASQQKGTL